MAIFTDSPRQHQQPDPTAPGLPKKSPWALIAISVVVLLAAAGAIGYALTNKTGQPAATRPPASGAAPPSGTTTPTTAATPASAVLSAYNAAYAAYLAVFSETRPVVYDPRIPQYFTGAELFQIRNALTILYGTQRHAVGTWTRSPVVTSVEASTATVTDCIFDHGRIVDNLTGATISGPDTTTSLLHVTMTLENGTWKVSSQVQAGTGCVPES